MAPWREEVDASGLRTYRALLGVILAASVVRFWAYGWIDELYIAPDFHFAYRGFSWVRPWAAPAMVYAHFAALFVAAVAFATGRAPRLSALLFVALFVPIELWDKATYLNHYVFVTLMVALLAVVGPTRARVNRLAYSAVRLQVGVVYFFAGLAKLNGDWLLRGEPLATWLAPHVGWLDVTPLAIAMSWAGAAYDLTVWAFMLHPKTRVPAFVVGVIFHLTVWALFPIGIFSFVMIASLTVFFPPTWSTRDPLAPQPATTSRATLGAFALWAALQFAVPARHFLSPNDTNWTEDGYRFAWRVMLVEKVGSASFRVETKIGMRRVQPRHELTYQQYKQMAVQPDMIVQYAHHISRRHGGAPVYVESFVAFNGRRSQRYLPHDVNLAEVSPWDSHHLVLPLR